MHKPLPCSRREFLATTSFAALAAAGGAGCSASRSAHRPSATAAPGPEPIIDIHQHTNYHGRTDDQMLAHQRAMGVAMTILLPAGSAVETPSTHMGKSNGLAAKTGGNQWCADFSYAHPNEFVFFANEVTDHELARKHCETFLIKGARGIGEQKFGVECDSKESQVLYELAAKYAVPVLLHFQEGTYNSGFKRLPKMFEKFPKTNFIMHAQTTWANIDANYDWKSLYPTGPVKRGGLTTKYLEDYPNCYADMSAGSGLNSLLRDEEHTRWFLEKHQDKIIYGSDCADTIGRGPGCQGGGTIAAIRKYAANKTVERKILCENARKMFDL
ncbi:MAG: amidohydrolase family protein [Verrucomicrobia bacterium]|nr:amidohydrolase family protein [Verrucomicrobiota bacterium]